MATSLHRWSEQEKLNKMEVDLIDITVSPDGDNNGTMAAGDFMFHMVEIPEAVSTSGGTSILQSCCAIISGGDADGADTGAFDVVITSHDSTSTKFQHGGGDIETDDDMASVTSALSIMDGTCGFFTITNAFDAGVVAFGDKKNIGMVCKAAEGTRSLYAYGIVQNTADYNEGAIVLRFGFVKD